MTQSVDDALLMGQITKPFGVKGWVKVLSFSEPGSNIFHYSPWILRFRQGGEVVELADWKTHGDLFIAQVKGYNDRNAAESLKHAEIYVKTEQLAPLDEGDFYWHQLVGLTVFTTEGQNLGRITRLFATGANDVIVVQGEREYLIPYLSQDVVQTIDLEKQEMIVDWDVNF